MPLDSLAGQIDIIGQIRVRLSTGESGDIKGQLADGTQASTGAYQAAFAVQPGAYVFNVLLREQSTGRLFGETINFDAK